MTDDPSKKILITAGIVPDILESLVTAITFISFGMFCILYFPYLYLGYGHLLTMILVTIAFCFIRRLRINQLLMIGLHLVFGAAFLFLLHIIFFQFLKNDITNTIFVGIIIFVLFIFSILKRYRRRIERSSFDSVVVALCVHVFMLLGSTFGAIPVDLSTILFDAILIVILYLSGRQLSVFESSYYHNLHSSTQPIHSIKRQNYISLLYLFGGVLFALIMLVLVPINPILSTLSKVMPLIGRFFGKKIGPRYMRLWRRGASITTLLTDTIPGIRVIKAFTNENAAVDKYNAYNDEWLKEDSQVAKIASVLPATASSATSNDGVAAPVQPSTFDQVPSALREARRKVTVTFAISGNFVVSTEPVIVTVVASLAVAPRRSTAVASAGLSPST